MIEVRGKKLIDLSNAITIMLSKEVKSKYKFNKFLIAFKKNIEDSVDQIKELIEDNVEKAEELKVKHAKKDSSGNCVILKTYSGKKDKDKNDLPEMSYDGLLGNTEYNEESKVLSKEYKMILKDTYEIDFDKKIAKKELPSVSDGLLGELQYFIQEYVDED